LLRRCGKRRRSRFGRTAFFLCLVLLLGQLPFGTAAFAAPQTLTEDFEGFEPGTTFKTNSGAWRTNTSQANWTVTEADGDQAIVVTTTGTSNSAFFYHYDTDWTDFTFTAKIRADHTNRVGIVGRYLDGNNYYLLSLNGGNRLELRQKSTATGSSVNTLADAAFDYETGKTYTLTLTIRGNQLIGSAAAEEGPEIEITAEDDTLPGPGKIGAYTAKLDQEAFYFDDIDVVELVEEEPEPAVPNKLTVVEVSASGHDGNFPENVLDDDLTTRWSAQSALVDGERTGQWLQFNLGTKQTISYVGLAFHNGNVRSTIFDLEVSDDGENWARVFSGQSSGTTLEMEAFDFPDAEAKYIRFVGYGNTSNLWNSITVAHIYGPSSTGDVVLAELNPPPPEEREDVPPYTVAGLYEADGTPHPVHEPNPVTGTTHNVLDYGAVPNDGEDDVPAILAALEAAEPGDEVFFPEGTYDLIGTLPNDGTAHLALKSGVNLRGESRDGTILLSHFDRSTSNSKVISSYAKNQVRISDLTISSTFSGSYSTDHTRNNPDRGGPEYGIYIEDALGQPSWNITIDSVTIEKFQKMGVRISKSRDIVVRNSTFRNMTDVGGGGAGYGVSIQGIPKTDRLGYANDTRHNLIENNQFLGPYMRHGVIIQYYAHNNEVRDNDFAESKLDAIDLHGEDEYLNKIHGNEITGVLTGAGIALGNTGGTAPSNHDASGPGNHIFNNVITNSREGIKVHMGSPDTLIENNTIANTTEPAASRGILIQNAPRTIIKDNTITNNTASNFWGILLEADPGDLNAPRDENGNIVGAGIPVDVQIIGNTITGNANGVRIDAGIGTILQDNTISGNLGTDFLDNTTHEPAPEEEIVHPSDDAIVDIERPDTNYGREDPQKTAEGAPDRNWYRLFNVKSSADGSTGRIAYLKFPVQEAERVTEASLEIYARTGSNTAEVTLDVFGIVQDEWDEATLVWNNSPNHETDRVKVTGVGETAFLLGSFTINSATNEKYSVDVTEFVRDQSDGFATFLIADTLGQAGNVNILSKEDANPALRPALKILKGEQGPGDSENQIEIEHVRFMDFGGNPAEGLTNDGFLRVEAQAVNHGGEDAECVLIAALYDQEGSMVRIAYSKLSLAAGERRAFGAGFDLPADAAGYQVRVFVWDSFEQMTPLVPAHLFP
jgi:parallel beta-helix repeat protein